jgi:hypothetical protein
MNEPGRLPIVLERPPLAGAGHEAVPATLARHDRAAAAFVAAADGTAAGILLDEPLASLAAAPDVDSVLAAALGWPPEPPSHGGTARQAPARGMLAAPNGATIGRASRTSSPRATSFPDQVVEIEDGQERRTPFGTPVATRGQRAEPPAWTTAAAVGLSEQVGRILDRARRAGPVGADRARRAERDTPTAPRPPSPPPHERLGDHADGPPARAGDVSSGGALAELVARWEGAASTAGVEAAREPARTESFGLPAPRLRASEAAGSPTPDAVRDLQAAVVSDDLGDALGAVLAREARRHGIEVARG